MPNYNGSNGAVVVVSHTRPPSLCQRSELRLYRYYSQRGGGGGGVIIPLPLLISIMQIQDVNIPLSPFTGFLEGKKAGSKN